MRKLIFASLLFIMGCNYNYIKVDGFLAAWSQLPIVINDDGSWVKLHAAVNNWNLAYKARTGHEIFTISKTDGVSIIRANLSEREQGRTSCHFVNFIIDRCVIRVDERKPFDQESLLVHELGHVIGLSHHEHTVMSTYLSENEVRTEITDNLLTLIESVYNKKEDL